MKMLHSLWWNICIYLDCVIWIMHYQLTYHNKFLYIYYSHIVAGVAIPSFNGFKELLVFLQGVAAQFLIIHSETIFPQSHNNLHLYQFWIRDKKEKSLFHFNKYIHKLFWLCSCWPIRLCIIKPFCHPWRCSQTSPPHPEGLQQKNWPSWGSPPPRHHHFEHHHT